MTKSGKKYLTAAGVILAVYLGMKYISPVVSPFIFAFLLAGSINPLVGKLYEKLKIRKSLLTGVILFLFCALIAAAVWLSVSWLIKSGSRFARQMPDYQKDLYMLLDDCCHVMEQKLGVDSTQVENFIVEQMNVFIENLEVKILPQVMGKSVGYMKNMAGFFGFIIVMVIAVILMIKDYERYLEILNGEDVFRAVREVGKKVILYVKTFLRAQLIILGIISAVCALGLAVMGMKGGIFYGLLTGFMDMLPFIGTGIMLFPLAFIRLMDGNYWQAFFCVCLYGICALIREFLEPKLIGEKTGIWPVGILFAVFTGLRLFGIWGIIKGPLSLVIVCETCKYLWDRQEGDGLSS